MSVKLANRVVSDKEMRAFYRETMLEMAAEDPRLCILDADLMAAAGMIPFREKYPERTFDCGVQEANMIGVAAGLSASGLIPFAHTFSTFASRRACDQIFMSCLYAKQNVKIMGSDPGVAAALNGGTHMPFEDIGVMRSLPEITIVEPCDGVAMTEITKMAKEHYGTWYIRMTRKPATCIYEEGTTFTYGKANMLVDGTDATIISLGYCVDEAMKAYEMLKEEGINVRVLDMFMVKPLDKEAVVAAAKETGAIVTAENHNVIGGLASAVAETLCEYDCNVPMEKIGAQDMFGEVGPTEYLAERFEMTAPFIVAKVKKAIARK